MTEENTNVSVEPETSSPPKPVFQEAPKVVKEAEHKLKEMSRKAKERKTAQNNARNHKALSEVNYFWLVIGGLGALGVGYLVFGNKEADSPKQRPRFKFVPPPRKEVKEEVEKEEKTSEATASRPAPKFELNCF